MKGKILNTRSIARDIRDMSLRHTDTRAGDVYDPINPSLHYDIDQHLNIINRLIQNESSTQRKYRDKLREMSLENDRAKARGQKIDGQEMNELIHELTYCEKNLAKYQITLRVIIDEDDDYYIKHPEHVNIGVKPLSQRENYQEIIKNNKIKNQ